MAKEYKISDILLYSVQQGRIVVIYDDVEALNNYKNKASEENSQKYAPVGVFKYTKELEEKILREMHHISSYEAIHLPGYPEMPRDITEKEAQDIIEKRKKYTLYEITYNNEKGDYVYPVQFSGFNKDTIQNIMNEQNRIARSINIEEFSKLPEEEKIEKKKQNKSVWKKAVAGVLAAIFIAAGAKHHADDIKNVATKVFDENQITSESTITATPSPISTVKPITEAQINEFAQKLYDETINKDSFILKYQQEARVNWSIDLARSVIELENGIFPSAFANLNDQEQEQKMYELIQAIFLIQAGNDYIETTNENVINLANYVINPIDKAIINNSIMISRQVICEANGIEFTPQIIEDYTNVDVFQKQYKNALEQLLDFEHQTLNCEEFSSASNGVKLMTSCLFRTINDKIPQYAHVHDESPEFNITNNESYYRYFMNASTKEIYYPIKQRVIQNDAEINQEEYVLTYTDSTGTHEKIFTRSEMYAMADVVDYYQDLYTNRDTGVEPTEGIHQYGIEVEVGKAYNSACAELLNKKYDSSKNWDGLLTFEEKTEKYYEEEVENQEKSNNQLITSAAIGLGAAGVGYATYRGTKKKEEEEVKTR